MQSRLKEYWLIILVLIIAFLLRFIPLFEYEFFYDELSSLDRIQYKNLKDIIDIGVKTDVHPALIQLFIFYWTKIGGTSEAWVKLPFLICGVLSCWQVFKLAKQWFNYKTAVISTIVVSCSLIFLVYSSSSHLYATGVLFALVSTRYLFEIVFGDSLKTKDYILFGLFVLLSALNHHMGALYVTIIGVLALVYAANKQKLILLITALCVFLLYLPHLSITLAQMNSSISADSGGWLTAPKWDACFLFLKTLFGTGCVIFVFILLFIYGAIHSNFSFKSNKKIGFLFLSYVIFCSVIYFYSIFKSPILQFSVLSIAGPYIIIVVAHTIASIPNRFFNPLAIVLIAILLIQTIIVKQYYSIGIKQGVKSSIVETILAKNRYGKNNVTAIYNTEPFFAARYLVEFNQKYTYLTTYDSIFTHSEILQAYLKSLKEEYIILSDPDAVSLERVKLFFPYTIKHDEGYFKSVFLLSKKSDEAIKDETTIATYNTRNVGSFTFPEKYKAAGKEFLIDSLEEFPLMIWSDLKSLPLKEGVSIVSDITYSCYNDIDDLNFDFAIKEKDSTLFYSGGNLKNFYIEGDSIQHGYTSVFMGTEFREWKNAKTECFFWNHGKKRYYLKDLNIKLIDSNPHRYTLWE